MGQWGYKSLGLFLVLGLYASVSADDLIYSYDGDVLPHEPSAGWEVLDPCEGGCSESLDSGHFVLDWGGAIDLAGYTFSISPPPTLWVEWRFASDQTFKTQSFCDASFLIDYRSIGQELFLLGDAVVSFDGEDVLADLPIGVFRTFRFESLDGANHCFYVDGQLFTCGTQSGGDEFHSIRFKGNGGCNGDQLPTVNRWDFIRYGTISSGEQIVASNPPPGFVDARTHARLDRFTVTFNEPNYVFIDEIAVATTRGGVPVVSKTRRLDNGSPETIEVVLDRPISFRASTRFAFDGGVVVFSFVAGDTDGNGTADLVDFAAFQNCFGDESLAGVCMALDTDENGEIDLDDYFDFESVMSDP